jgi:hypothetical protein
MEVSSKGLSGEEKEERVERATTKTHTQNAGLRGVSFCL